MPNVPPDLSIPATAVTPAQPLSVETGGWQSGHGEQFANGSYPVLAIGWYGAESPAPEPFAYLIYDKVHNEICWIAHSLVERVNANP